MNRKAIGPVVATALLLVIAVVAVVGFESWYNTYQSKIFSDVEIQSLGNKGVEIVDVIGRNVYVRNDNDNDLMVIAVKIDGVDCNIGVLGSNPRTVNAPTFLNKSSVNELSISGCLLDSVSGGKELFLEVVDDFYNIAATLYAENGSNKILNYYFYQDTDYDITKICSDKDFGDANCDGEITLLDQNTIKDITTGVYGSIYYKSADCNNDTFINFGDIGCVVFKVNNP